MSLVLDQISHRFGGAAVVDGASLSAAPGEIVCLVGHSGCGKTTLLRIAAGLEPLQTGSVSLDGETLARPGAETPPEKRAIGFVFQDFVLFPHLSVEQNLAFGLKGAADAAARIERQVAALRLGGLEKRYPHELSGGQQQRVALARALVRAPRALLLDEPFASIDAVLRRELREELRALLRRQEAAVVLVTHDPEEALALGDRIAFMRAGRIVETASPEALFEAPKTPEAAMLFHGRQKIHGVVRAGVFESPFGAAPAPGAADGAAIAVLRSDALTAEADAEGGVIVRDIRFIGPDWRALVAPLNGGPALAVRAPAPPEIGARLSLSIDHQHIHVFSAS